MTPGPRNPLSAHEAGLIPGEQHCVVQVAIPVPLRRLFDYRSEHNLAPGTRVNVPFGRRTVIGVVVSNYPAKTGHKLKHVMQVLDTDNLFGERLLDLLMWASRYYHHPVGEVLQTALPVALRKNKLLTDPTRRRFIRALGDYPAKSAQGLLGRAPLQNRIFQYLVDADWVDSATVRKQFPDSSDALRRLQKKGLIEVALWPHLPVAYHPVCKQVELNSEQQVAVDAITTSTGQFSSFLLHGITGSGKTEVYLDAAEHCITNGTQVLILVPEIALTPQLVSRVKQRLGQNVCVLHSALSNEQRYHAWWLAREGHAVTILGTRSAVFTPLKSPGLILVDEEHDISYKQQDGFRYHARDLAIQRARMENIPVVLGSATPSMETRRNVNQGRHRLLQLGNRIGAATLPRIEFIDLKQHRPFDGISMPLLQAIEQRLINREQTIIFLNRRGFAPIAQCPHCDWQATCDRCDARLTYHRDRNQFRCHHCGRSRKAEMVCAACGEQLYLAGAGTQRLEQALKKKFPDAQISRFDRDQVTTQDKLERELEAIQLGQTDIIIGTQLIAKGHDFSRVTLVGIINSDQGLYSIDFRAQEFLFQQLTQVSGRAGRAETPGQVLIQTAHPDNHTLQFIRHHDFEGFSRFCLEERQSTNYPPYSFIALWRAESTRKPAALTFLRHAAAVGERILRTGHFNQVQIMDAVISPMEKLAGRYRAQLMVRSNNRGQLHQLLLGWIESIEKDPQSRRARWSIDIDPMEMF